MREQVEMVDGRIYFSDDGWQTVARTWRGKGKAVDYSLDKGEADLARYLAVYSHGGGRDDTSAQKATTKGPRK